MAIDAITQQIKGERRETEYFFVHQDVVILYLSIKLELDRFSNKGDIYFQAGKIVSGYWHTITANGLVRWG